MARQRERAARGNATGRKMADAQVLALDDRGVLDDLSDQRETSADRNLSPPTLGQDLRKSRESRGITPEVIWRNLKIAPHHLTAIETGCFAALPGRVYAVGFVRSYARYLGLDVEHCLARLKAELPEPDISPAPVFRPLSQPEPAARFGATPAESVNASDPDIGLVSPRERLGISPERSMQHYVVIGLIIAVLVYGGYNVFSSARLTARAPVVPVPARLTTEAGLTPKKPKAPEVANSGHGAHAATALTSVASEITSSDAISVQSLASITAPVLRREPNRLPSTESAVNIPTPSRTGIETAPFTTPSRARSADATSVASVRPRTDVEPLPDLTPKPNHVVPVRRQTITEPALALPPKPDRTQSFDAAATNVVRARPNTNIDRAQTSPPEPVGMASTEGTLPKELVPVASEHTPRFRPPLPLGVRYGLENGNSRVVLRLHRSIRVAVKGNRNHIFIDRLLGAGATYRVPNTPGVKLTVPDGGAVEVILDGNTVGFAGRDGVAARGLGLDPPSIIRRYHWQ